MATLKNIAGQRFGRLVAISHVPGGTPARWSCECDCGKRTTVSGDRLRSGKTRSCGCLRAEATSRRRTKHGMCRTVLYSRWNCMLTRCFNKKSVNYERYGGRGITVCERWLSFDNFRADMESGFSRELQLEREDNALGYSPDNCFWATKKQQARNKRDSRILTFDGISASVAEWAERTGISSATIRKRISCGWSVSSALTVAVRASAIACIFTALFVFSNPANAAEDEPEWLAHVGSASGVVLHSDGWIVSAEHVIKGLGGAVDVVVAGKKYRGKVVDEPPVDGIDGATAIKIDAKGLKYARLARAAPAVGDKVAAYGYPKGKYARTEGRITEVGSIQGAYKLPGGYEATVFVQPGSSGGPLMNDKQELVGLCHGVELTAPINGKFVESKWIGLGPIRSLMQGASVELPPATIHAYAFVADNCPPCTRLKADVKAGRYPGIQFHYVTRNDRAVMERLRKRGMLTLYNHDGTTEKSNHLPNLTPCVWIEGTSNVQVGYGGVSSFVGFLKFCVIDIPGAVFQFVGDVIFGAPAPVPDPGPSVTPIPDPEPVEPEAVGELPQPDPAAIPFGAGLPPTQGELAEATEIDFSGVSIVALVAKTDLPPTVAQAILDGTTGPIEAAVKSKTDGKASLYVVAERTMPSRFNAVKLAANSQVDKVRIIVIVGEQNLGIKGILANVVEAKVQEMVGKKLGDSGAPVDLIFERLQSDDVAAIRSALTIAEQPVLDPETGKPVPEPTEEQPWYYGLVAGILPAIRRYLDGRKKAA